MKTYTYQFITGDNAAVEVDEKWYEILKELDRLEYNNDQKETRRHVPFGDYGDGSSWLADEEPVTYIRIAGFIFSHDDERFKKAVRSLTDKQYELYEAVYCYGMSIKEFAEAYGIDAKAASKRNRALIEKFKKYFV